VGLASSAAYTVVILLLTSYGSIEPTIGSVIAYVAATVVNFPLQRRFAFRSKGGIWEETLKYAGVHLFNMLVSATVVHAVVHVLGWPIAVSVAAVVVVVPLMQFLVLEAWVFPAQRHK
jgi:putative flippase GtrA